MQRWITVSLVSVTESDDGLGNITETPSSADYDRVRFAPRSSAESAGADQPRVITAAALYRRGEFPVGLADRIVIADQHAAIDGTWQVEGEVGRWATGVEVAVTRTGAAPVTPVPDPEPGEGLFRRVTAPGQAAVDETDLRLAVVPDVGYTPDEAGDFTFFDLLEGLDAGEPSLPDLTYANLYLITASVEPSVAEGDFISSGRSYVQMEIDAVISYLAGVGVTAELAGQGVLFDVSLSPLTVTEA